MPTSNRQVDYRSARVMVVEAQEKGGRLCPSPGSRGVVRVKDAACLGMIFCMHKRRAEFPDQEDKSATWVEGMLYIWG